MSSTNNIKKADTLADKVIEVQGLLKAPKSQTNNFSKNKFKFRSAEDILESVKPLLVEREMLQTLSDEIVVIGDRYYVQATVTVSYKEESMSVKAYARETLSRGGFDESQLTGSASSYARKYALNGMWCIDDTKDADTDEYQEQTRVSGDKVKKKPASQSNAERKFIKLKDVAEMQTNLAKQLDKEEAKSAWTSMLAHFKVTDKTLLSSKRSDYEKYLSVWGAEKLPWQDRAEAQLDWIDEDGD